MKCVVIGGGASGMLCAGTLAKNGHAVTLIEKNEKLGKKLYITGKGRCNVTNNASRDTLINNIVSNPKFAMSALSKFSPQDTMAFFEEHNVPLKIERGNRVFPESDKSSDIIKALSNYVYENNVDVHLNENVQSLIVKDGKLLGVKTTKGEILSDVVIVATGGVSYPATGSTGDGYKFAKALGHNIVEIKPGLNGLIINGVESLAGLSLKNVEASAYLEGKELCSEFGEMLFTHIGVSGPIILTLESKINKFYKSGKFINKIDLQIDLKPAISIEELDARLLKDFKSKANVDIKNLLPEYMPKALIEFVLAQARINKDTKCNSITKDQRYNLIKAIKGLQFKIEDIDVIEHAIITAGGVDVKDINPKNMQSKIVNNLYFIGEVLDIDALTGGFNIQLALSTAFAMAEGLNNE